MIQPSLLEYSVLPLKEKLNCAKNSKKSLQTACCQKNDLFLHIDIVGKNFAKKRHVLMSNSFITVLREIISCDISDCVFTTHLMYEADDHKLIWENLKFIKIHEEELSGNNIKFHFFVNKNFAHPAQDFITANSLDKMVHLGIWLDLGKWENVEESEYDLLLMTVKAGESGKSLESQSIEKANKIINKLDCQIIIDGGVNFENIKNFIKKDNLHFVSYSAIWNKLNI